MERKVLLLASYCGTNDAICNESRPCIECLKMCNIYVLPSSSNLGNYDGTLESQPKSKKLVWLRSTKQLPDVWIASSDEEYETGKHLARFNWKQVLK